MNSKQDQIPGLNPRELERMLTPPSMTLSGGITAPPREWSRPRFIEGMPWQQYSEHPAVSRSTLDKIMVSPKHLRWYVEHGDDDSAALTQGRVLHTLILEPDQAHEKVAVFGGKVRNGKAWDEFQAANAAKDIVTLAEMERLSKMRDAFYAHPSTKNLVAGAKVESVVIWEDPATHVDCKARPDIVRDGVIYELKTTRDISTASFAKDAANFGYHRQAAWYQDAAYMATGQMHRHVIIAVEKDDPFDIRLLELGAEDLAFGRLANRANLNLYARCLKSGDWPGFPGTVETLELPRWAL